MYKPLLDQLKTELERVLSFLAKDLASLRAGRATPALVEDIEADYYGTRTPVKHLAAIHITGPRDIQIQPWDQNAIKPLEEAIRKSNLGLNPAVDKMTIRLTLPPLTEERRKELVKLLKVKAEEARISVRRERDEILKKTDALFRDKKIGEDDKFRAKDEAQKIVDGANKRIDDAVKKKEEEIMAV